MLHEQTMEKLYSLRLHGMAHALQEQMKQPEVSALSFEERLAMLVDAQWLWKENRALALRLRNASLKHRASIENVNYRHTRQLDRSQVRSLASCQWVKQHQNVLITGPTGIGKSYLCCALLDKACREGHTAYYAQAHKLFRQLAVAYVDGSYDKFLSRLARTDVLAIDDWALIPLAELPSRYGELDKSLKLAVHCRSGARSARAVQFLIGKGYDAVNVSGGIIAWSERIDPTLPVD